MSSLSPTVLKHRVLNGWYLFGLVSGVVSLVMLFAMLRAAPTSGPAVSELIQLSVRWSVPWLYLAFAASSVQVLWPGPVSLWLARNRKYLGLCFAAAMAWQGLFILWMVLGYTDYYVNDVYVMRDAIEGVLGYLFLIAMTATSFMPVRRRMSPRSWKWLHKIGIYYLWAYAFSVYWWELFYYGSPDAIDYVYYWAGLLAWALRALAWAKKRRRGAGKVNPFGVLLAGAGLAVAATGAQWYPHAERLLYGYSFTRIPELYLPYWPFEPWFALLVMGFGAYSMTRQRAPESSSSASGTSSGR